MLQKDVQNIALIAASNHLIDLSLSQHEHKQTHIPQKIAADKVLTPIVESIDNADGSGIVKYAMDKQTKELWNGLIGAQFQLNKHWQIRTEAGIVGNRKSFLVSVNYRFLL